MRNRRETCRGVPANGTFRARRVWNGLVIILNRKSEPGSCLLWHLVVAVGALSGEDATYRTAVDVRRRKLQTVPVRLRDYRTGVPVTQQAPPDDSYILASQDCGACEIHVFRLGRREEERQRRSRQDQTTVPSDCRLGNTAVEKLSIVLTRIYGLACVGDVLGRVRDPVGVPIYVVCETWYCKELDR